MVMILIIAILGICGKMGQKIYEFYKNDFEIIGIDLLDLPGVPTYTNLNEIERVDLLIDFSSPSSKGILIDAIKRKIPVISGTTGYDYEDIEELNKLAISLNTYYYWSCNYAKGIGIFEELIDKCKKKFKKIDFVETHASTKKDIPSGTAKMLATKYGFSLEEIQSLRLHDSKAIHELIFTSENEKIYIKHEIIDSKAFIEGFNEVLLKCIRG